MSKDLETGGREEFDVLDMISVTEKNYVLVIEAKRSSYPEAMKQCLLSMKDIRDNNGASQVYGFTTFGEGWRMFSYDGKTFRVTRKMYILFEGMEDEKERWIIQFWWIAHMQR